MGITAFYFNGTEYYVTGSFNLADQTDNSPDTEGTIGNSIPEVPSNGPAPIDTEQWLTGGNFVQTPEGTLLQGPFKTLAALVNGLTKAVYSTVLVDLG